jgi:hypothetical protein
MSRNRIIYQSLGVFASQTTGSNGARIMQTGASDIKQLTRVQSFDSDFTRNLTDINQFGNLAFIDRLDAEAPTVTSNVSYYVTDGLNEKFLGLTVTTGNQAGVSCIKDILQKNTDEKNLYLLVTSEGSDASSFAGSVSGVVGIGNTFITSYTLDVAVGDIPTATVALEALNTKIYGNVTGTNDVPAVNPENGLSIAGQYFVLPQHKTNAYGAQPTALLPGDATLDLTGVVGFAASDLKIQSASMSFDLTRTPINKLGSRFSFAREIDFPVTATLSVETEIGDLTNGSVSDLLCQTGTYDLTLKLKKINCSGQGDVAMSATLKGAKLVSQALATTIGGNATLSADFEVPIGGPEDTVRGIFLSGSYPVAALS